MGTNAAVQLQWTKIENFKGLWSAGDRFLMPQDAAQTMSGCYPQPGGGLRSFFSAQNTPFGNGIDANAVVAGFHVRARNASSGYEDAQDLMLVTHTSATLNNWKIWRRRITFDTSWANPGAVGPVISGQNSLPAPGQPGPRMSWFANHATSLSPPVLAFQAPAATSQTFWVFNNWNTEAGLYTVDVDSPLVFPISAGNNLLGPVVSHQARLVLGADIGLIWTDVGSIGIAAPGVNFLIPAPDDSSTMIGANSNKGLIAWMVPVPPSDLLVCTLAGRVFNIQGDLLDPIVRELGRWGDSHWQHPVLTPYGAAVIEPNNGIALYQPSGQRSFISPSIDPRKWYPMSNSGAVSHLGLGQTCFSRDFLFCPNPQVGDTTVAGQNNNGALVYDFTTQQWFTSHHTNDVDLTNPRFMQADGNYADSSVWVVPGDTLTSTTPAAVQIRVGNNQYGNTLRNSTWEWCSAPFHDPGGNQVEIREINLLCFAFSANSTMQVTINGTTKSVTLPSGRSLQVLQFRERALYLDVDVKGNDPSGSIEAPILESIAIGWQSGHSI